MNRRFRFSSGGLMLAVAFLTADAAAPRECHASHGDDSRGMVIVLGAIPAAHVPVLGLIALPRPSSRGGARRPFLLGFEVAGWASVGASARVVGGP